ncbi:MAG: tyrosine recombinase XerC [Sideroxydans sp.]|nr:tyrosine recombinase XerC [Sideroxydans sp.]
MSDQTAMLAGFLAYLQHERHYSPHTSDNYARDIRRLLELAGNSALAELKSHHIRRYIAQLHGSGLSGRSLARVLSSWRGFYNYLMRDHHCPGNPCVGLRAPKSPKTLPHALSPDEAVKLVEMKVESPQDARDKAMFELLYSSGLRLAELVGLDLAAMQDTLHANEVRVTGKGSKTRVVPVGQPAIAAIRQWMQVRDQLANVGEQALFVGARGARIAPRTVELQLQKWAVRQGLNSRVHPHMLRHSFATHVLQSSGDLRAVQEMLGHASISTTQVYTHLDFQYLAKIYDGAHPRARKKS